MLGGDVAVLSAAKTIPPNLSAVAEPNGDIYLRYSGGEEAEFAVIGVVCGESVVPPATFSRWAFVQNDTTY